MVKSALLLQHYSYNWKMEEECKVMGAFLGCEVRTVLLYYPLTSYKTLHPVVLRSIIQEIQIGKRNRKDKTKHI